MPRPAHPGSTAAMVAPPTGLSRFSKRGRRPGDHGGERIMLDIALDPAPRPILQRAGQCPEGLEFKRISARIEQEHGCLFADLALETDVGFDHEAGTEGLRRSARPPTGPSRAPRQSAEPVRRGHPPDWCGVLLRRGPGCSWITSWWPKKSKSTHCSLERPRSGRKPRRRSVARRADRDRDGEMERRKAHLDSRLSACIVVGAGSAQPRFARDLPLAATGQEARAPGRALPHCRHPIHPPAAAMSVALRFPGRKS